MTKGLLSEAVNSRAAMPQLGLSRARLLREKRGWLALVPSSSGKTDSWPSSQSRNRKRGRKDHGHNTRRWLPWQTSAFWIWKEPSDTTLRQMIAYPHLTDEGNSNCTLLTGLAIIKSTQNDYVAKTTPSFCKLQETSQRRSVSLRGSSDCFFCQALGTFVLFLSSWQLRHMLVARTFGWEWAMTVL